MIVAQIMQISEDFPEQFITSVWNHVATPVLGAFPASTQEMIQGIWVGLLSVLGMPLF